jgi:hypothetical protein
MPPHPSEFEHIVQCLNNLKEGKPIENDRYDFIKGVATNAINDLCGQVVKDTSSGPQGKTYSTWLVAPYGGGKSQILAQVRKALGDQQYGGHKVFVSKVNLNHPRDTTASGLHLALFETASYLLSGDDATSQGGSLATRLVRENTDVNKTSENVLSVGVDIVSTVFNVKVPGSGILARSAFGALRRAYVRRSGYLRKQVQKLNLREQESAELMVRWLSYAISPDETRWKSLDEYANGLSQSGRLFHALTDILRASGYASVVILVDQAEKLIGKRLLTDAIMNIRDPEGNAGINLFFVFAGTAEIEKLRSIDDYGGFVRRFLDENECSSVHAILDGPVLSGKDNDIDRVRGVLDGLRRRHPGLPFPKMTNARIQAIRQKFTKIGTNRVAWSTFWKAMLEE